MRNLLPALSSGWWIPQLHRISGRAGRRFGQFLAALALLLQITFPSAQTSSLLGSGNGAPDLVHALCVGSHGGTAEAPVNQIPNTAHHTHAACCFWHGSTGLVPVPAATAELIEFAHSAVVFTGARQATPPRLTGSVGARAPPARV